MSRSGVPAELRRAVWERAGGFCEYCRDQERFSPVRFHCEHIIAVQHDGPTTGENLALACPACNFRKGPNLTAIDPASGAVVALFQPRLDRWSEHFEFQGGRIFTKTPAARATARLLEFNSPERIAAREFERQISSR